jgi:hypothetical protein
MVKSFGNVVDGLGTPPVTVAFGVGVEVGVVGAGVDDTVDDDWILSELSEPPPPQAVRSSPAETATAAATGREVRVTICPP